MSDLQKKQQIARENGRKSHGPITPEGKKRSSLNGITHGLAAKCVVLANESQQAYDNLFAAFQSEWQPASVTEASLLTEMVNSYWRLRRIWSMETALFDTEMFCQQEDFEAAWSNYHPAMRVTDALCGIHIASPATLETLHRYETRYDRIYKSSMDRLIRLRRLRNAPAIAPTLPARPQPLPQPEEAAPAPEPAPPANWLTRLLAFFLSLLAILHLPASRKSRKTSRKTNHLPTEPVHSPALFASNGDLPEIFCWFSDFTPTPTRRKAEPAPAKPPKQ